VHEVNGAAGGQRNVPHRRALAPSARADRQHAHGRFAQTRARVESPQHAPPAVALLQRASPWRWVIGSVIIIVSRATRSPRSSRKKRSAKSSIASIAKREADRRASACESVEKLPVFR